MEELILTGSHCKLTVNHLQSHYRIPVLVLDNCDRGFGPSQQTYPGKFKSAADCVRSWALSHGKDLSSEELDFIKLFLGQWPEGPQLA